MNASGKQLQRAGDHSTNYQAQNITVQGLTYSEAKEIALDVFRANALELSTVAQKTAKQRVEELTEAFFKTLLERAPEAIESISEPDMQRSIFRAQEEYACSGDKDLGEVLVDMLVDRAATPARDLRQVTLNEAIKTASKLTAPHFAILGAILIAANTKFTAARTVGDLHAYLTKVVAPTVEGLRATDGDLRHLQYAGCLSIDISEKPLSGILAQTYPAFFTKGFTREEIGEGLREIGPPAIIPCLRDPSKFQVGAMDNSAVVEHLVPDLGLEEHSAELQRLMNVNLMPGDEIEEEFASLHPNLRNLVDVWGTTAIRRCDLTGVGMALGHANLRRILGEEFSAGLEVWVH
ncbi:LPO_1073/Vpar_1526 family protein [Streptomyces sp. NPDC058731]|uniref:LPO_1073/Vpar_1526 family protein n=1 Tax=Streptomyces sp. NPDC058731 TaxID=3346613 RepID=UPI0036BDAC76